MVKKTHEIRWFEHRDEAIQYARTQPYGTVASARSVPECVYYDPNLHSACCEYGVATPMSNRHGRILEWARDNFGGMVFLGELQCAFSLSDEEAYWISESLKDPGSAGLYAHAGLGYIQSIPDLETPEFVDVDSDLMDNLDAH